MKTIHRLEIVVAESDYDCATGLLALEVPFGWEEQSLPTGETRFRVHCEQKDFLERLQQLLREKGVDLEKHPALQLREYIYDMDLVMRSADLVISRAGASTIGELTALGVPALMVPSPYVANNHQEKNARALEEAGGAVVLTEGECSPQKLFQTTCAVLRDREKLSSMETSMAALGIRDATERIYQVIQNICK